MLVQWLVNRLPKLLLDQEGSCIKLPLNVFECDNIFKSSRETVLSNLIGILVS